jgi:hypothetical protein
LDYK